jgi:hypothetical protein
MGSYFALASLGGGGKPSVFLPGQGNKSNGQISPTENGWPTPPMNRAIGKFTLLLSLELRANGRSRVEAEPSHGWRGDGKEIFYLGPSGMMTAVPVSSSSTFSSGSPVPLFQFHGRAPISDTDIFSYDVTKDGKRFLVNRCVKPDHIGPLTILLNAEARSPN